MALSSVLSEALAPGGHRRRVATFLLLLARQPSPAHPSSRAQQLRVQHSLLGMPRRRCSLWKPLKVAFRAWLITALLQGVSKGSSQLAASRERAQGRQDSGPMSTDAQDQPRPQTPEHKSLNDSLRDTTVRWGVLPPTLSVQRFHTRHHGKQTRQDFFKAYPITVITET